MDTDEENAEELRDLNSGRFRSACFPSSLFGRFHLCLSVSICGLSLLRSPERGGPLTAGIGGTGPSPIQAQHHSLRGAH